MVVGKIPWLVKVIVIEMMTDVVNAGWCMHQRAFITRYISSILSSHCLMERLIDHHHIHEHQ
jgi:hypothetical protein